MRPKSLSQRPKINLASFESTMVEYRPCKSRPTLPSKRYASLTMDYTILAISPEGPSLACRARLAALGVDPQDAEDAYDTDLATLTIGSFTDIYTLSLKHPDLGLELTLMTQPSSRIV